MVVFFLLFSFFTARAYHQVESTLNPHTLLVRLDPAHGLDEDHKVVVLSGSDKVLVAIGHIKEISLAEDGIERAIVSVDEVIANRLVMPNDPVEKLTAEVLSKYHVTGHISLMLSQERQIPARYKDLAYMGVFNADGHTLSDQEWLVSIPQVQYGVSDSLTVKVLTGLFLDGFANIGGKLRVMRNHWGQLTLNSLASRQVDREDYVFQSGLTLTLPSNGRFQSHLIVNARIEDIEENNPEVDKLNLFPQSDIRTIYEYVTDDWDRLLFGPLFNFETQTVGGTISHIWIWDTFHFNLGVATKDVREFELSSKGYNIIFDFFWRF